MSPLQELFSKIKGNVFSEYTVFDSNGNVKRFYAGNVTPVVGENEVVSPGRFAAAQHYLKDSAVKEYTEQQKAFKANKPDDAAYWSNESMSWVSLRTDEMRLAEKWVEVREIRDKKLLQSDWTTLPDVPLTDKQKQAWMAYRQQLRDITLQQDPFSIVWPIAPGG